MNNTVNLEDNSFVHFWLLSYHNSQSKVCITDCIMPGFNKQFISTICTWWFKGKLFH